MVHTLENPTVRQHIIAKCEKFEWKDANPYKREINFCTTITEECVALQDELLRLREGYSYSKTLLVYDLLPLKHLLLGAEKN